MKNYLEHLKYIKENGVLKENRTGIDALSTFGHQMRFDLQDGFPIITTKKIHIKSVIYELLWFLNGDTNIKYLKDNGVSIWDEWADNSGDLGRVYGAQWRDWRSPEYVSVSSEDGPDQFINIKVKSIDQITWLVERLKTNPDCRRMVVTAWNPGELDQMALAPCHMFYQLWTRDLNREERIEHYFKDNKDFSSVSKTTMEMMDEAGVPKKGVSLQLYQRSTDFPLGLPYNISSYSLLTMIIAQCVNMIPLEFIWTGGDNHIYCNQIDGVNEQLTREPFPLPIMKINPLKTDIFDFKYDDFELINYKYHPHIKMPVAV